MNIRPNEKMLVENLMPSVKRGGSNVIIWGCCGGDEEGDLYGVKGILKKEEYHSIFQCHAKPIQLVGSDMEFDITLLK